MKIAHFIKRNILGFILGVIVTGIVGTVALNIQSRDVSYSNSNTNKTNVQDAITELYSRIDSHKVKIGSVPLTNTSTTKVTLGFKPKYISLYVRKNSTNYSIVTYNGDVSTTLQAGAWRYSTGDGYNSTGTFAMPYTKDSGSLIYTVDSDGFTLTKYNTAYGSTIYYFAVSE